MALTVSAEHTLGAAVREAAAETPLRTSASACVEKLGGCFFNFENYG